MSNRLGAHTVGVFASENVKARPVATLTAGFAACACWLAPCRFGFTPHPKTRQRNAGEADAEFLQRRAARNGLRHALGEFIECVVHTVPCRLFGLRIVVISSQPIHATTELGLTAKRLRRLRLILQRGAPRDRLAAAEFPQRRAARNRLGHALREFVELGVHDFVRLA
jgi:hypothetical protein